jgi:hypothetical protein
LTAVALVVGLPVAQACRDRAGLLVRGGFGIPAPTFATAYGARTADGNGASRSAALERIAELVGHCGTSVTEKVYRDQLRPVLLDGAAVMDEIFRSGQSASDRG